MRIITNYVAGLIRGMTGKTLRELGAYEFPRYESPELEKRRMEVAKMRLARPSKGLQRILRHFR